MQPSALLKTKAPYRPKSQQQHREHVLKRALKHCLRLHSLPFKSGDSVNLWTAFIGQAETAITEVTSSNTNNRSQICLCKSDTGMNHIYSVTDWHSFTAELPKCFLNSCPFEQIWCIPVLSKNVLILVPSRPQTKLYVAPAECWWWTPAVSPPPIRFK